MRILITAGGTREYIDPVRYITNAGSGRMGYALARAASAAGHEVRLISAPSPLIPPKGIPLIPAVSSRDMYRAVREHFDWCRCLIMTAAVADYTPARPAKHKLKKEPGPVTLELKPTVDILKWAGRRKKNRLLVGFALEDKNPRQNALRKFEEKLLDMIVLNSPAAIGAAKSKLDIYTPDAGWLALGTRDKNSAARKIIRIVETL